LARLTVDGQLARHAASSPGSGKRSVGVTD
jgi:hypothetical protein